MKKIFAGILAVTCAFSTYAQDKALLETLVKKGMLTQQEATQIAKESVEVTPSAKTTKQIRVFGGMQGWFKWADNYISDGTASLNEISGFELKYVKFGLEADVGSGWTATLVMDFGSEGDRRNYLDKVVISKNVDIDYINGTMQIGLRKSNMGIEQITDDFGLLAIDRSIATNVFTHAGNTQNIKCFGGRTVGIFWDGEIPSIEGLYYSAAITSEITEGTSGVINNINANSGLSYYVAVGYKNVMELNGRTINYDLGVNTGYASKGFERNDEKNEIWGVNPYAILKVAGVSIIGEMFYQNVQNGKTISTSADAFGANLIVAYKVDLTGGMGELEPVVRFSYVTTDGLGAGVTADNKTFYFDDAKTLYVGVNWYPTEAIKTSIGYEYGWYENGLNAVQAERLHSNMVLAQLQVVF
ncbi:MAG: hypothetical protein J6B07_00125 [Opitutales bacterium]|nr:hypothetical protein [Opitutales bacterium]